MDSERMFILQFNSNLINTNLFKPSFRKEQYIGKLLIP